MTNKQMRLQIVKLMKKRGIKGKLYYGNKKAAWKWLTARHMKRIIYLLSFEPDSLINDCDMFNHRVSGYLYYYINVSNYSFRRGARVFEVQQLKFDDGQCSCGCPFPIDAAKTREKIESYFFETYRDVFEGNEDKWMIDDVSKKRYEALKMGNHIVDENGILLPEFSYSYEKSL